MYLNIKQKILLIILPVLIVVCYFSALEITATNDAKKSASETYNFVELSAYNSRLVHELQKERGMSAGFLGSQGSKFESALVVQRKETDRRLADLQGYLTQSSSSLAQYTQLWAVVDEANKMLARIESMRRAISNLSLPLADALNYYTTLNSHLLSVPGLAVRISKVAEISRSLAAYYEFLQGKERAGIERAVLSNTFGQGEFSPGLFRKFVQLVSEQNSYFSTFETYAAQNHINSFNQIIQQTPFKEVENYRAKAFNSELEQNPELWFSASTNRINLLKEQEEKLTAEILDSSHVLVAEKTQKFWLLLTFSLTVIVLTIYFSFILLQGISRQVNSLNNTMQLAAKKNLVPRCTETGGDELSVIARNLNSMLNSLTDAVHVIASSSEQLATAAETSEMIVTESAAGLKEEYKQVLLVVSAIEQMSVSVREVATNILTTSEEANTADELIAHSSKIVGESTDTIHQLSSKIDNVSNTINELHESSSDISSVVDVIQGIAEQTNLLALNAAIEAARAGEYGRGFAVVADEVRSLAQRTQDSTLEIETMVTKLQGISDDAYTQVSSTKTLALSSVEKSAQVQDTLQSVVASIARIQAMAAEISAAAEQQVTVSTDISSNAQNISHSVDVSVSSGEKIAIAAKEQTLLADKLKRLANQFETK
ncbi:methyl-accepting chemotaxis protein [Vibrio sp. TH_r3]|uniref:methyl-accepting chemotaxis protein n=1 Tax=Vibrio sp. TH_r3 TaxID=3082084 RepID=UPI0029541C2A|nr:methyl-accepting chemotaxis protein [Vibrio sp. TH_r3]MDV7104083.1 methyl-accepting chemotaxis protein [Vibrio sp. TH_r3]